MPARLMVVSPSTRTFPSNETRTFAGSLTALVFCAHPLTYPAATRSTHPAMDSPLEPASYDIASKKNGCQNEASSATGMPAHCDGVTALGVPSDGGLKKGSSGSSI